MRVLSFDPGVRNMAYAVSRGNEKRLRLITNGMVKNPVTSLVSVGYKPFINELDDLVINYKIDRIIMERFQARGIRGNTGELISFMMGIVQERYARLQPRFITAATWKNDWNKRHEYELKDLYKVCSAAPHQLDATLIGIYRLEQEYCKYKYKVNRLLHGVGRLNRDTKYKRKLTLDDLELKS